MLNYSTREMAMVGVLSALSVAMGYSFIFVPNIEMISASIFISGYLLGVQKGIVVGIVAESIFSAFNP
ncbi:MAG: ECF transporter S component, partial [Candidatus Marinimicrobia bacterium]|nr:ECF transporter S component [Candidatus Neomarinimicrobiota bacterium]